jgi:hypothetical protein
MRLYTRLGGLNHAHFDRRRRLNIPHHTSRSVEENRHVVVEAAIPVPYSAIAFAPSALKNTIPNQAMMAILTPERGRNEE